MDSSIDLKALLFSSNDAFASVVSIPTLYHQHNPSVRFPFLDPILDPTPLSTVPICRTIVFLVDEDDTYNKFFINFKYHPGRGQNFCLRTVEDSVIWEGELVVMQGGVNYNVIGLVDVADRDLACLAVKQYVSSHFYPSSTYLHNPDFCSLLVMRSIPHEMRTGIQISPSTSDIACNALIPSTSL